MIDQTRLGKYARRMEGNLFPRAFVIKIFNYLLMRQRTLNYTTFIRSLFKFISVKIPLFVSFLDL